MLWVDTLIGSVNRATDGLFKSYMPIVGADPLRVFIKIDLQTDLPGACYHPFHRIASEFAGVNGCVVERIHKGNSSLTIEVVTKRRLGQKMNNNPLVQEKKSWDKK